MPLTARLVLIGLCLAAAQEPTQPSRAAVSQLGKDLFAIGSLRIDTARREVSMPAKANDASVLEFVANTRDGLKAYESALTVDTNGVTFNAAMLLIGLDPKRARVPTRHFDPVPPSGDPVEISVEWMAGTARRRIRVEQLLFDQRTKKSIPEGPWAYTGSTFLSDPYNGDRYMADLDGVLIGFVHSPSPVIENPRAGAVDGYGSVVFNRNLGLLPGMSVTLTVRAISQAR